MMKNKKFLAVLAMVFCLTAGFSACGLLPDSSENSASSDTESSSSVTLETASIVLNKTRVSMNVYDSVTLTATLENVSGDVEWTSSDASVATVQGGVVNAVGEGEAVITASVGEVSATCAVSVSRSSEIPTLKLSHTSIELLEGESFTVTAETIWKNQPVENVTYAWMSENTDGIANITSGEASGSFKVEGLKAGEADYTLCATAMDSTVYAVLSVKVVKAHYELAIEDFTAANGGYEYTLCREQGKEGTKSFSYTVTCSGKVVQNATVGFVSDNTDVVTVSEDGTLVGKSDGTATITATVSGDGFETFTVTIKVTVKELIYHTVTYYAADKETVLHTEKVLAGEAAPTYAEEKLPKDETRGDYTISYTGNVWVTENGTSAENALLAPNGNLNVYLSYTYTATTTLNLTKPEDSVIGWNGTYKQLNSYATVTNGTLSIRVKPSSDSVRLDIDESTTHSVPVMAYLTQNVWNTVTIEFDANGNGKKLTIIDSNGTTIKNATVKEEPNIAKYTTENVCFIIMMPITAWTDPLVYGDSLSVDVETDVSEVVTENVVTKHTVKYYDADGNLLHTEEVGDGDPAVGYVYTGKTLDNGYTETYSKISWVTTQNGSTVADLSEVKGDVSVYAKLEGEKLQSKRYDLTHNAAGNNWAINALVGTLNENIALKDGKVEFWVRSQDDDVLVSVMETVNWNTKGIELKKGEWYRYSFTFVDGHATSFVIYDSNGNVAKEVSGVEANYTEVSDYTPETLYLLVKTQRLDWNNNYAETGVLDIAAVKTDTPDPTPDEKEFTVTYYDEDGNVLSTEKVKEGEAATYTASKNATTDGDGYTHEYTDLQWQNEDGSAADLSNVTANIGVYLGYTESIWKTEGAKTSVYPLTAVTALNKYVTADENGNVTFKVRVAAGCVLRVSDNTGWTGTYDDSAICIDTGVTYTVTINGTTKEFVLWNGETQVKSVTLGTWNLATIAMDARNSDTDFVSLEIGVTETVKYAASYTVTYYDENGNVLSTEKVKEGKAATYGANGEITLSDGYTHQYSDLKWMTEQGGSMAADLSSISANVSVYLSGTKTMSYIKVSAYDKIGAYPLLSSVNKYVEADENGNITFKIRLNGSNGAAFSLYEKQSWNDNNYGIWLEGTDWYTVTIDGVNKHVVVTDKNGNVWNDYDADIAWYTPETLSIVLNADMDVAAIA